VIILFQIRYICRCEDVTLYLIFFLHGTCNSYSQKTFGIVYKKVPSQHDRLNTQVSAKWKRVYGIRAIWTTDCQKLLL